MFNSLKPGELAAAPDAVNCNNSNGFSNLKTPDRAGGPLCCYICG